jgi:hypothetical protein
MFVFRKRLQHTPHRSHPLNRTQERLQPLNDRPNPHPTHRRPNRRNGILSLKSVINNERWDGRASRSREFFEQRQWRRWERRKRTRTRASPTTTTTTRTPIYTRRTSPPPGHTTQCRMGTRTTNPKGSGCAPNTRTLPTTRLHFHYGSSTPSGQGSIASGNELGVLVMMAGRVLSVRCLLRTSNPTSAPQPPLRVPCSRTRIPAIL